MNDELDPELDPELNPGEEARVRALLADLGSAPDVTAMPPEVAARLDETLAGLVADREAQTEHAPVVEQGRSNVVPLRRRWTSRATAAAAAVIVLGLGGVAVANLDGFQGGSSDKASSDAGGISAGGAESLDESSSAPPAPSAAGGDLGALREGVPRLTAASFDADAARLVAGDQNLSSLDGSVTSERKTLDKADRRALANAARSGCPGPQVDDGATETLVLYDDAPAVLVIHPARQGERLVEAFACGDARVLDSTRVPVTDDTSGQSSPGDPGLGSPSPTP